MPILETKSKYSHVSFWKGKKLSEEHRKKLSLAKLGKCPWNKKGLFTGLCISCNKSFSVIWAKRSQKYCSIDCSVKMLHRKEIIEKRADTVRGSKRPRQSLIMRGEKCNFWKGGKPKCIDCGKELLSYKAKRCRQCVSRIYMAGKNNPNWNNGSTPINQKIRTSFEYKQWRKSVFKRDNYTCHECGNINRKLNADHIKPFAYFPELRFELSNGRTLCVDCHRKTTTYGSSIRLNRQLQWA